MQNDSPQFEGEEMEDYGEGEGEDDDDEIHAADQQVR